MEAEKRWIISDRIAVPAAVVIAAFLALTPTIMWAANTTSRLNLQEQQIAELKAQAQRASDASVDDATRITVLETNYTTILTTLAEIKQSFEKIETRLNLR